jgi:hypothetical protein
LNNRNIFKYPNNNNIYTYNTYTDANNYISNTNTYYENDNCFSNDCNNNNFNHYEKIQKEISDNHSEIINRFYNCLHAYNM